MNDVINTILTSVSTTFCTQFFTMVVKERLNHPFFHLTMCNEKCEPISVEQTHGLNKILRISNDSHDFVGLDVASIFTVKSITSEEQTWRIPRILSNRIDYKHPLFIDLFEGLPLYKKNHMRMYYQLEKAELYYTTSLYQKRQLVFERESKMIIQKGKPHMKRYSLTQEKFHGGPYRIK